MGLRPMPQMIFIRKGPFILDPKSRLLVLVMERDIRLAKATKASYIM